MNTENTLKRAYAHWINDGLLEIQLGILLVGVGTLRAIIHFAEDKSPTYYWLAAGLLVFMIGSAWGGKYVINILKARLIYPRTGYMTFKPRTYNYKNVLAMVAVLIFGVIIGGTLGMLSTQPNEQEIGVFVPIGQGIVAAMILTYAAQRTEVKRLYYLAALFFVIGLAIGVLGVGIVLGVSFFYLSIGLAMVVTGSLALRQYLRSHDPVDLNGGSQ
jgi:hypothetical protein